MMFVALGSIVLFAIGLVMTLNGNLWGLALAAIGAPYTIGLAKEIWQLL